MADYSWAGAVYLTPGPMSTEDQRAYLAAHPGVTIAAGNGPQGWGVYAVPQATETGNIAAVQSEQSPVLAAAWRTFPGARSIQLLPGAVPPQVLVDGKPYEYNGTSFTDLTAYMANATKAIDAALAAPGYVQGTTVTYKASAAEQVQVATARPDPAPEAVQRAAQLAFSDVGGGGGGGGRVGLGTGDVGTKAVTASVSVGWQELLVIGGLGFLAGKLLKWW